MSSLAQEFLKITFTYQNLTPCAGCWNRSTLLSPYRILGKEQSVKAVHMPLHKTKLPKKRKKKSHQVTSTNHLVFLFFSLNRKQEDHPFKLGSYRIYRQRISKMSHLFFQQLSVYILNFKLSSKWEQISFRSTFDQTSSDCQYSERLQSSSFTYLENHCAPESASQYTVIDEHACNN